MFYWQISHCNILEQHSPAFFCFLPALISQNPEEEDLLLKLIFFSILRTYEPFNKNTLFILGGKKKVP